MSPPDDAIRELAAALAALALVAVSGSDGTPANLNAIAAAIAKVEGAAVRTVRAAYDAGRRAAP